MSNIVLFIAVRFLLMSIQEHNLQGVSNKIGF